MKINLKNKNISIKMEIHAKVIFNAEFRFLVLNIINFHSKKKCNIE
jgi:hypothetical protein